MYNAVILCGGLSTRLGDITKDTPKILLEVGGRPILDWQLEKLKSIGVKEAVLAAGHLAHILHDRVGGERLGLELIYAIEDKKLGTGGAIRHGLEYILYSDEPTFVLNGDILYTIDFTEMAHHLRPESDGIIYGARVEDAFPYGTLVFDEHNHLLAFKEKEGKREHGYINGGLYMFNQRVADYFPKCDEFSIEYDVFPYVRDLDVYLSDCAWVDVGVPERLAWARENYSLFG